MAQNTTSDYHLELTGVEGESKAMPNHIDLESFSFGAHNPASIGGDGLAAGKASLSDFTFSCQMEKASYQLLKNLYTGTHIDTATFIGRKTGGGAEPYTYLKAIMTKCLVTSHSTGGGSQGIPMQHVTLAYEQIEFQYWDQSTDSGSTQLAGSAAYNVAQVKQTK